jgi:hypothetical protein
MIFSRRSFVVVCAVWLCSFADAQLFVMNGEVWRSDGIYSQYTAGTKVHVSLDFSAPLEDLDSSGHTDLFKIPAVVTIGTDVVFGPNKNAFTSLIDGSLFEPVTNAALDGIKLFGELDLTNFTVFELNLLTSRNVLSSPTFLPAGIPMSDFTSPFYLPSGYLNHLSFGPTGSGFVQWLITDYSIVPVSFVPVPEPPTYGVAAVTGLLGLFVARLRQRGRIDRVCCS